MIHREPPDLSHRLLLPQQVGLHRHRHRASVCFEAEPNSGRRKHGLPQTPNKLQTSWRSFKLSPLLIFPSSVNVTVIWLSKYLRRRLLVGPWKPRPQQPMNCGEWRSAFQSGVPPESHDQLMVVWKRTEVLLEHSTGTALNHRYLQKRSKVFQRWERVSKTPLLRFFMKTIQFLNKQQHFTYSIKNTFYENLVFITK